MEADKIKAGDTVTCIGIWGETSRELPFRRHEIAIPEKNKGYTIREVVETPYGTGVTLVEIVNPTFFFENIGERKEPIFSISKFQLAKN